MRLVKWGTVSVILFLLAGWIWFTSYVNTPSSVTTDTVIYIPHGTGVRSIKTLLAEKGLIKDDIRFLALVRLTGQAEQLRAGEYKIPPNLKPGDILQILAKGEVLRHHVTIPEGMTLRQVGSILDEGKWIDLQRFTELTRKREFINSLGIQQDSLEGYLFPDTYSLTRGDVTEESIITMMVTQFFRVWKEITANTGPELIRHQVVTLASIVEKESATANERPLIARVFINRLEKKMRLQSDPTVIYGIDNFSGNLTRKDLERNSPYNTYRISGMPPGPICNPGKDSIQAVLHPADAPYLYFVSKNDGTHQFSTTLKEHNKAVRTYQKRKKQKAK